MINSSILSLSLVYHYFGTAHPKFYGKPEIYMFNEVLDWLS